MSSDVAELTMPVVEYGKDDEDELLNQPMKKYRHEASEDTDAYSVVVTVPSNALQCFIFLCRRVEDKMFLFRHRRLSL